VLCKIHVKLEFEEGLTKFGGPHTPRFAIYFLRIFSLLLLFNSISTWRKFPYWSNFVLRLSG